jgi:signal peptidase I
MTDSTEPQQPPAPPAKKQPSMLREAMETILFAVIIFLVLQVVVRNFRIEGDSMLTAFENGQFVLVDRVSYRLGNPHRGDVVVFEYPRAPQEDYIKRVIGLPGETIRIADGRVYINGQPLSEPYVNGQQTLSYRNITLTLAQDQYFVMGDNRNYSSDSRAWGSLPRANIIGKAWICYWPPSAWRLILRPQYP